jgi:hypothetical protein
MPVQINEVIIKVFVDETTVPANPQNNGAGSLSENVNEDMAEKILEIIQEKKER